MLDGSYHLECSCNSDEHELKFTIEAEEGYIYISTFLNHYRPWYKRAWVAIKYIFGYKCKYGHFDNTLLDSKGVLQLKHIISEYERICNIDQTYKYQL